MMSMKTWEKLSPELQSIVQDAAVKAAEANRTYDNEKEAEWLQFLKDKGMEVTTPDTAAFREAVKPVYEKYEEEFGKELVEAILAE